MDGEAGAMGGGGGPFFGCNNRKWQVESAPAVAKLVAVWQ